MDFNSRPVTGHERTESGVLFRDADKSPGWRLRLCDA